MRIVKVEEINDSNESVQIVTIVGTIKKVKCPICLKYTTSIHDKLKPIKIKYNKVVDKKCYLILLKRRFICHRCKKKIVEDLDINLNNRSISKSLEIKIRKDLLKQNFNIKQIADDNDVSQDKVREILKDAMSDYPNHLKTLPQVISVDEFAAHTSYGKYALIINDPMKKRTLDILPSRKKDYLLSYFTKVENRGKLSVICMKHI